MTEMQKQKVAHKIAVARARKSTSLDLRNCGLNDIPAEISHLSNLTTLNLSSNNLSQLPETVTELTNLTTLYLSYNKFFQLPKTITKLVNLTTLDICSNRFFQFPESITKLVNLTALDLSANQFSQLPESIVELVNLTTLYFRSNNLSQFPIPITNLVNLNTLYLSSNNLSQLPEAINQLINLTTLYLSSNNLSQLPKSISQLVNIRTLYLSSNSLSQFPETITQLSNLITLSLSFNNLSQLPETITQLSNLKTLYLSSNNLSEFPEPVTKLTNLTALYLSSNNLSQLPKSITKLEKLEKLLLNDNPIKVPLPEIVNQGVPAIFNYFRELAETDHIYEAKLFLVGEEGVGKTSIAKSLTNPKYILENEPSKESISIQTCYIPKEATGFEKLFRLNIWDIDGQEIYHATHQLFFSKNALYLLVIEASKNVRRDNFDYWLNVIQLLSKSSPVILIQNKCDLGTENIAIEKYKKQFTNVIGKLVNTSCKPNQKNTIHNLQKIINQIIKNRSLLPHLANKLPKIWVTIRQEIAQLQIQQVFQITYQEYIKICQKHYMDAKRADFLAAFFHDSGIFLHFKENTQLKKTVFIDNEWVIQGIYKILDSPMVIANLGEFSYQNLSEFWENTSYSSWETDFIELMCEFKICYPLENKGQHYFTPQRLPQDEPESLAKEIQDWEITESLLFEYCYDFMPRGMLTNFIVKSHKYIYKNYQWRYGVLLKIENAFALVREYYFEHKIIIKLSGSNKRDVLAQVLSTFKKIHDEFKGLIVQEMVPCNCPTCKVSITPYFYDYKKLLEHRNKGRRTVLCEKTNEEVNILELIENTIIV